MIYAILIGLAIYAVLGLLLAALTLYGVEKLKVKSFEERPFRQRLFYTAIWAITWPYPIAKALYLVARDVKDILHRGE